MAATPFEHAEQARLALRAIVAEHGPEVLSSPAALSNLLSDLLPESPRIAKILVAAAQDQIANELREHTSVGMDTRTASRLAASSFADATMFAPEACAWVVEEFARALGLTSDPGIQRVMAVTLPEEPRGDGQAAAVAAVAGPARPAVPRAGGRAAAAVRAAVAERIERVVQQGIGEEHAALASATPVRQTWFAVVTADRAYFDGVVADRDPDEVPLEFPADYAEQRVELAGTRLRIGRRSASRGLRPEIDLGGPPADPGISHLHAVLIAQQDGTWSVIDTGSSNGTQANGREIDSGEPAHLRDGDSICLGAWTRLTIHIA